MKSINVESNTKTLYEKVKVRVIAKEGKQFSNDEFVKYLLGLVRGGD